MNRIFQKVFSFLLISTSIAIASAHPTTNTDSIGQYFWFPNPNGDGTLLKAYLTGKPGDDYDPGTVEDIHFHLYTKANPDESVQVFVGDRQSFDNSNFDRTLPVKFISHGFGGTYLDGCPRGIRQAYMAAPDAVNVIVLNWEKLADDPFYLFAANFTKLVGERTAELIDFMVTEGLTRLEDVHFIGHSLGSHVAANAGFAVKSGKIGRISALDPALPLFEITTDEFRIDPTDAVFVDVMHTGAGTLIEGGLGFQEPRGHVDYYPNSGRKQPNCGPDVFSSCSHGRTCDYFRESILATPAQEFTSCRCTSWEGFKNEECVCKVKTPMGAYVDVNTLPGNYYLHTNGQSPFGRGDDMTPPTPIA